MVHDQIRLFEAGLSELGYRVTIGDRIAPNAINLVWENFRPGHAQLLRESGVVYGIIATEMPDGEGFNWRRDDLWTTRWESFPEVAKGAAFIWALIEQGVPIYSTFAPTGYLEIGFSERLVPTEACWDPEFDFAFFGQINPYRQSVLDHIGRYRKVKTPIKILLPAELNAFIGQCRVGICFRHSPQWPIPSSTRLGLLLHAKRGVAAEFTPVTTRQSSLVPMAPENADFAEFCLERLTANWRSEAENAFERYRAELPMSGLFERIIDETVLGNSRVGNKGVSVPDEERSEIVDLFPPEILLEESYLNYNIVRVGGRGLVAVAQALGSIDILAILSGRAQLPPEDKFIIGGDARELKDAIDSLRGAFLPDPVLQTEYRNFNIVRVGDRFVAVSLALGEIDVRLVLSDQASPPHADQFIVATDVEQLRREIDKLKAAEAKLKSVEAKRWRKLLRIGHE